MSEQKTETNKTAPIKAKSDNLVAYTAPLLPGQERQDLVVGVNGQFIRIRRGECVRIEPKFVHVLENAQRQQAEAYRNK